MNTLDVPIAGVCAAALHEHPCRGEGVFFVNKCREGRRESDDHRGPR